MTTEMSTHLHQNTHVWNSELGCFISTKHEQLAQVLQDYNRNLSLVFIPPAQRDETDTKPFAILDTTPGRRPYIVRYLTTHEIDNTEEVLAWVFEGDLTKHRPSDVLSRMEARERAERALKLKAEMEYREESIDLAEYVFSERSPNYMKHNGQTYRK